MLAIAGCFFACLFGIAHTLLPGHGKTIICGYCVGRKRDTGKILFISGVTTFTHLFASAALGALAMTTSHILVRNIILPKLQLGSALLLLAFGLVLFISRLRGHEHHHDGHHHHHHASLPQIPTTTPFDVTFVSGDGRVWHYGDITIIKLFSSSVYICSTVI